MRKILTPEEIEKYKQQLLNERNETEKLIRDITELQKKNGEKGATSPYSLHQADTAADTTLAERRAFYMDNEIKKLKEINYALKKIYDGDFGICEMCGKPIQTRRLDVIPYAHFCIECETKEEQKRHRRH
jgi:RNA polymerase-binding protein DksA